MSGSTVYFTPEIIHSYDRLENFLVGEETTERAISQVVEASRYPNWSGKWEVTPLLALPCLILALTAKIGSCALYILGSKRASVWLNTKVDATMSGNSWYYSRVFGDDFLAPSLNQYSPEAVDIYMQPSMTKDEIEDPQVREIINPFRFRLEFDQNDGMCRGESLWFIRLYLKTKRLFQNSRQHLQAIGQQFSWGAPAEAALIQKLCPQDEFLRFRRSLVDNIPDEGSNDESSIRQQVAEAFQGLQPGAYILGVPKHAMAYISTGDRQGYFFDPNKGTIAIHDEAGFQELANIVISYREEESQRMRSTELLIINEVEIDD